MDRNTGKKLHHQILLEVKILFERKNILLLDTYARCGLQFPSCVILATPNLTHYRSTTMPSVKFAEA